MARALANGLRKEDLGQLGTTYQPDSLSFEVEDFAMPVGTLSSPHIEHLMQAFSNLFSRIGLPDLSANYIASLWKSANATEALE